jgi:DNA repair protein RadA
MSQNANDFPIEDLPDVKPHLISKLKRAGIDSIHELAVSIPNELVWNKGIGDDVQAISDLVTKARRSLIDSGLLVKEFCTAEEILERRKDLVRFSTGSAKLDTFLNGGIETQAVTEIAGEFGTGKSQICHTLCVTANAKKVKPHSDKSGCSSSSTTTSTDHNIIFIDTENTFRAERVHQIAETRRLGSVEEILKRIFVCKIYNSAHLEYVIANLGKYIEQYKANLVIVDSVISLHRAEYTGRETLADRQQRLNILLHKLVRLTEIYNIAIVITNQVQSMPDNSFGNSSFDPIRLAGGNIMAHASTYRIFLRKAGRNRIAIMLDSPSHAYSQVKFAISEIGIQDIEEDKDRNNKYSESGW